jgi:hypothetical protein
MNELDEFEAFALELIKNGKDLFFPSPLELKELISVISAVGHVSTIPVLVEIHRDAINVALRWREEIVAQYPGLNLGGDSE